MKLFNDSDGNSETQRTLAGADDVSIQPTSRKRTRYRALSVLCLLAVSACLDPYPPPVSPANVDYLVIDGFLNSASSLASVSLSRALPLDSIADYPAEQGALVQVERTDGTVFNLPEVSAGQYEAIRPELAVGSSYRLLVRTADGQEYRSDYVTLKQSPVLEDVSWSKDGNGITIHVDSRDPSGETRYYQWLYKETWEYDSDKQSGYFVRNGFAVSRDLTGEKIHICYSSVESSKVFISTTSDQSGDVINDFPLVHIPRGSKKLSRHYSILVQQRALDEESYSYWLQLQRTTENLGGLFDPLPSPVTGNVKSVNNPREVVLGYFTGGGVEEKRIYINHYDLPVELRYINRQFCPVDSVDIGELRTRIDGDALMAPYGVPFVQGYTYSTPSCMDCRSEGGTLDKPAFWPF